MDLIFFFSSYEFESILFVCFSNNLTDLDTIQLLDRPAKSTNVDPGGDIRFCLTHPLRSPAQTQRASLFSLHFDSTIRTFDPKTPRHLLPTATPERPILRNRNSSRSIRGPETEQYQFKGRQGKKVNRDRKSRSRKGRDATRKRDNTKGKTQPTVGRPYQRYLPSSIGTFTSEYNRGYFVLGRTLPLSSKQWWLQRLSKSTARRFASSIHCSDTTALSYSLIPRRP